MKFGLFSLGFMLLYVQVAVSVVHFPPSLGKLDKQVRFLIWLEKEIPWMLQEGAEYDIDFLKILNDQNELREKLLANEIYKQESKEHPELVQIRGRVEKFRKRTRYSIDQDYIDNIKENLEDYVEKTPSRRKVLANLVVEIDRSFERLQKLNSQALLAALGSIFPLERSDIYGLSRVELLAKLKEKEAPKDLSKVNWEAIGIKKNRKKTWEKLLKKLEEVIEVEDDFFEDVTLFAFISNAKSSRSDKVFKAERVENIGDYAGGVLREGGFLSDRKALSKLYVSLLKKRAETTREEELELKNEFLIKEVPPYLGIFRGIVGGDCSTSYSMPYPYAAAERTFFLYDRNGALKGYVQATEVQVARNEEKYLYIHDLTGARLSVTMAMYVLTTLHDAAEEMGYSGIALPGTKRIDANQNYVPLREALQLLVNDSAVQPIRYVDSQSRALLSEDLSFKVNSNYDIESANKNVFILSSPPSIEGEISFEIIEYQPDLELPDEYEVKEAVFLVFGLLYGTHSRDARQALAEAYQAAGGGGSNDFSLRAKVANQIASLVKIEEKGVLDVFQVLQNNHQLNLEVYYQSLGEWFKKLDIELTPELIDSHFYLFADGHLRAPDFHTSNKSTDYALFLLKRWPTPEAVFHSYRLNPEFYNQSIRFQNYVESLAKGGESGKAQLRWLKKKLGVKYKDPCEGALSEE